MDRRPWIAGDTQALRFTDTGSATTTAAPTPASTSALWAGEKGKGGSIESGRSRDNGITAARLILAFTVIVSHSFTLTGGMLEPLVAETGQVSVGFLAVLGFFGLSGYLLARSRQLTPVRPFLWNRALRILPGYWVALVFGAITASIGALLVGKEVEAVDGLSYVITNVALLPGVGSLPAAFDGAPINGSLWTLGIEASCYLVLALTPVRCLRPVALGLAPALLIVWTLKGGPELQLGLAFLAGAITSILRIPVTINGSVAGVVLAIVGYGLHLTPVAGMAVAFAALGLAKLPFRFDRDISYGVYVFGFPLGQVLTLSVIPGWGAIVMAAVTIVLVLPLAWLSWTLVESPALRLRKRRVTPRARSPSRMSWRGLKQIWPRLEA